MVAHGSRRFVLMSTLRRVGKSIRMQEDILYNVHCVSSVKVDIQMNQKVDLKREATLTSSENWAYIWKIQQNTWHNHFNRGQTAGRRKI